MGTDGIITQQELVALWGKSHGLDRPYPLVAHLLDTAAIAQELLPVLPSAVRARLVGLTPDRSAATVAFYAGLHDLGKATPAFQRMDPGAAATLTGATGLVCDALPGEPSGPHHSYGTQLTLPEALAALGVEVSTASLLGGNFGVGCALGGHHGRFAPVGELEHPDGRQWLSEEFPGIGSDRWPAVREGLARTVAGCLGVQRPELEGPVPDLVVFTGFVVVCDWLASQDTTIGPPPSWPDWSTADLSRWYADKRTLARQVVADAGLAAPRFPHRSFEDSFGFAPNEMQSTLETRLEAFAGSPGIVVVTVPMGQGKTEAALRAATVMGGDDRGLYFALPTMATADAMFDRVLDHVARTAGSVTSTALAHGYASLSEAYTGLPRDAGQLSGEGNAAAQAYASSWLRGRRRALLSAVAAGTVDQVLAASLPMKHGPLRWLALAGKTVVVDEAHSLDPYMHRLLERSLNWLGALGVPVVVLSATLPRSVSASLVQSWCRGAGITPPELTIPYPGWLHVDASGDAVASAAPTPPKRLRLELRDLDWGDDTALSAALTAAVAPVGDTGCALVVCNTVRDAQRAATLLQPWCDEVDAELTCLHSRMPLARRRDLTSRLVDQLGPGPSARPRRAVVVATQVVEQSLDVDFDTVVSALAPVAPLLQRAGRGHRHRRDRSHLPEAFREPNLTVLVPSRGGELAVPYAWTFVYPQVYLARTLTQLRSLAGSIALPDDVQILVDDVYEGVTGADPVDSTTLPDSLLAQHDSEWAERNLASQRAIPVPGDVTDLSRLTGSLDDDALSTRLGMPSTLVLLTDAGASTVAGIPLDAPPTRRRVRQLLDACIPLRVGQALAVGESSSVQPPGAWATHGMLADVVVAARDTTGTVMSGARRFRDDPLLGWVQV